MTIACSFKTTSHTQSRDIMAVLSSSKVVAEAINSDLRGICNMQDVVLLVISKCKLTIEYDR